MAITYIKLRSGEWGLKSSSQRECKQLEESARTKQGVQVRTKAGKTKWEVVGKVIWTDASRVVAIATLNTCPAPRVRGGDGDDGVCPACGEAEQWELGCHHPWHEQNG
jgi:hypothetical protein